MRRVIWSVGAVFLAAALASCISLFVGSGVSQAGGPSQGSIAEGPALPEENFPAYSQVVDNSSPGRFKAPGWDFQSSSPGGYGKNYRVATLSERTRPAQFKVKIPATDVYSVYARWPAEKANNAAARFGVSTTTGIRFTKVNQRRDGGFWVKLGEYRMKAGDSYAIQVLPVSRKDGYVVADAVAVVRGILSAPPESSYEKAATGGNTYTASTTRAEGRRAVRIARRHIGTKYVFGGLSVCEPFKREDCSCHTRAVFSKFGKKLPDSPVMQWKYGRKIARSNIRPGDLVFFKERGPSYPITHVGIFSGNGKLVHASSWFGKVVESEMKYIKGYYGAKRLSI